jgi:proline iminopeptidase
MWWVRPVSISSESSGYIHTSKGRLWYRIVGGDKPGTPLLTVHGGPGQSHDYLFGPISLLGDERPVVFYDQRDSGQSDRTGDRTLWNIESFMDDLETLRHQLGLDKLHILGQSWGSMLTSEYMVSRKPDGVMSLIFSGANFSSQLWCDDQLKHLQEMPDDLRSIVEDAEKRKDYKSQAYAEATKYFYHKFFCRLEPWPDSMNIMSQDLYEYMWGPSEFSCTGNLKEWSSMDRLGQINVPTLLTCGEYDESTPETNRRFQKLIPDAELVVFPGGSHEHHLEYPEKYVEVVRDFLRRVESRM